METYEYLYGDETNRHRELTWGVLREPPSPFFSHQQIVLLIAGMLRDHVERHQLGVVAVAPLDVVLDAERHLIVQPDVLFVSTPRLSIIRNQVWGAPDLVVEVCSVGSLAYDGGEKREWYKQYGVTEYWLVDPLSKTVAIVDFSRDGQREARVSGKEQVPSALFPELDVAAFEVFGERPMKPPRR